MKHTVVQANYDKLPRGWQQDPLFREEVYQRVRALRREGFYAHEIAIKVGCSDKSVERILKAAA